MSATDPKTYETFKRLGSVIRVAGMRMKLSWMTPRGRVRPNLEPR